MKLHRHATINENIDNDDQVNYIDDLSKAIEQYKAESQYGPGVHNSQRLLDAIQAVDKAVDKFKSGMTHDMEDIKVMAEIGKIAEITNLKSTPYLGKEPKTLVYSIVDERPDWTEIVKKHLGDKYMGYKVIYTAEKNWRDLVK